MVTLNTRDVELINVISFQIRGEFLSFLPENLSSFGQFSYANFLFQPWASPETGCPSCQKCPVLLNRIV